MPDKKDAVVLAKLKAIVTRTEGIASEGDLRLHLVSSVRLILQQAVYGLFEWACSRPSSDAVVFPAESYKSILEPTDGTLIDSLESIVIICEKLGWLGVSRDLFAPVADGRPCREICPEGDLTVSGLLRGLVRLRNDGAEGHGLVGGYNREAEIDCLKVVVEVLEAYMPRAVTDTDLEIGPEGMTIRLKFLRLISGFPLLIRKISSAPRNRLRVEVQYHDAKGLKKSARFEADNAFMKVTESSVPKLEIWNNSWSPYFYFPERTTDSFAGRTHEQTMLADWFDDEDSRVCLIFGDGGVGKTTLVLEFIHKVLEEDPDISASWKPKLVTFYTAKKWQWGLNGLELIKSGQPYLLGLLANLYVLLVGKYPESDFYKMDVAKAAMFMQQVMRNELGLGRGDHLIVIDNSETLITTDKDVEDLGREIKEIGRRVGRVIVTSRRREVMEAAPIPVAALKPLEAVSFIKQRALKLGIKFFGKVEDKDLLALVNDLECRPIVLEAFCQALSDKATGGVSQAKARVTSMLRQDLGDFLFADAWARYSKSIKRLLLLLVNVADVHDAKSLALCAEAAAVSLQSAEEALEESSGIASVVRSGGGFEVSFSSSFLEFSKGKLVEIDGRQSPSADEISSVRYQYAKYMRAIQTITGDRIASAFRVPAAKAAYQARREGDLPEALRLYQQAVVTDQDNGWLFDRFAYFLFHDIRDYEAALLKAQRATELLPDEGEVWLTRGIIESRLGLYRQCEVSIARADRLGIDRDRCAIQLAWAYLKAKPALLNLARKRIDYLKQSLTSQPRSGRAWIETERLISRLKFLEEKGRNVRG